MKELRLTITINTSAKELFNFTLNPQNTPRWIDFIAEEAANDWPPQLGTIYRNRGKDDPTWSELKITEHEPDKSFTLSKTDDSYHVRYVFTPLGPHTTELEYYEWTEQGELAVPFTMEPLEKLKRVVEAA